MPVRRKENPPRLKASLQVAFYYRLQEMRSLYFSKALKKAVDSVDLETIHRELTEFVSVADLKRLASFGIRGEVLFPVPCVLVANPFMMGYYRLLLGFSQKEIYNKGPFGAFKRLEDHGEVPAKRLAELPDLCRCLVSAASDLLNGVDDVSLAVVHDLQLLTLGPQLRGGENTRLGQKATQQVFDLVKSIAKDALIEATERTIVLENTSGRRVTVEFASDPDIRIVEKLPSGIRSLVSVEIKGGTDASNIHNRLGEAEKSHQKAKNRGFFEFWTILNVVVDQTVASRESPTTTQFFDLSKIVGRGTAESKRFRETLASLLGLRT